MRILFLLRHFLPEKGGMATQMHSTVHYLKKHAKLKVIKLPYGESSNHPYINASPNKDKLRYFLQKTKKDFSPDIVHFDSVWPYGKLILEIFSKTPKVISVGGRTFSEFRDYHKYTKSNYFIGKLKGLYLAHYTKKILNKLQLIFSEGFDIKDHLKEHGIKTKIVPINNGLDISRFKSRSNGKNKVLFFGRYSWENGPDRFIKITKDLRGFESLMVGYGPLREKLKELAKNTSVTVRGPVEWEKIPSLLSSVDYVILPFRRIGGISQTVTESMASGKVVLTTPVGDLPKIFKTSEVLFFETEKEAKKLLLTIHSNKTARRKIERLSKKKIKKDFAWENVIKHYVKAYKTLI